MRILLLMARSMTGRISPLMFQEQRPPSSMKSRMTLNMRLKQSMDEAVPLADTGPAIKNIPLSWLCFARIIICC